MAGLKALYQKLLALVSGYDFFQTLKHTSVYFTATILINALGIISLPIYTSFLDATGFGIVEVFNNTIKLLAVLMTLNVHQSIGRYYFEEKADWKDFIGTSFLATIFIFILISLLLFAFKDTVIGYLNVPSELFYWLFPATISVIALTIFNQLFVARKESQLVARGQVFFSYARFAGAVACLFYITPSYYARIVGDVVMACVISVFLIYKIYPLIKWKMLWEHLKYIGNFSIPLIPVSISGFILNYFDLYMINSESNSDAGLYAFAYKIGILFMGLDRSLQNAAQPDFYKWMNRNKTSNIAGQVKSIMKFEVLGAVFLILFAFDMGSLLASKAEFTLSLHLVPIIVIGYLFFGVYNLYSRLLLYTKKTYLISIITIFAAVVNIVLNSIFIPKYGFEAAAYTTLASYVLMCVLAWILAVLILKLPPPPLGNIVLHVFYVLIVFALGYYINEMGWSYWGTLFAKAGLFISVCLLLFGQKIFALISPNSRQ